MFFGRVAHPLDTVGEDRNGRVVDLRSFHRPSVVADHDLVEGETFFGPSDENAAGQRWYVEHHARLAKEPLLRCLAVQDPAAPGHRSVLPEAAVEQDSQIPELRGWKERELLLALLILRVGRVLV